MNCFLHFRRIAPSSVVELLRCNKSALNKYGILFAKPYSGFQVVSKPQLYNFTSNSLKGSRIIINQIGRSNTTLANYKSHNHSSLWVWERAVAASLIASIPACAIFGPHKVIETVTLIFVFAHLNWGLEAICIDYLRPSVVGEFIPKLIPALVNVPLLVIFFTLSYLTFSGDGVFHEVRKIWSLKTNQEIVSQSKS